MSDALASRVASVRARIDQALADAGRTDTVTLVAASKTRSAATILAGAAAGLTDFGENYVQELVQKAEATQRESLRWHFIGHLQRNKVKHVLPWIDVLHTLDSPRLADAVQKASVRRRVPLNVLLQVNIGDEDSKHGILPAEAEPLARHVLEHCPNLALKGLMVIPPVGDPEPWFDRTAVLRAELASNLGHALPDLSMGMSGDLEQAIHYGATYVRVGSDLFGERD